MKKGNDTIDYLKTIQEFCDSNGNLLINKILQYAEQTDSFLMEKLLKNRKCAESYFVDVDGVKVFKKEDFINSLDMTMYLPYNYTKYSAKIKLANNQGIGLVNTEDVVLEFPYKDCVISIDSTNAESERCEKFYHSIVAADDIDVLFNPKAFTQPVRHDEANPLGQITSRLTKTDNLLIHGNNLFALHSLAESPIYQNQIKFMYWDILYNTTSDTIPYNDSFKHSTWLVMMKNRLEIAKELLSDDGIICMQCDDNEQAYLTVLADEIFGRNNRVNTVVVEMASSGGLKRSHKDKRFLKTKEYILIYSNSPKLTINELWNVDDFLDTHYSFYFDGTLFDTVSSVVKNNTGCTFNRKYFLQDEKSKKFILENANKIYRTHDRPSWTLEEGHFVEELYNDEKTKIIKMTHKKDPNTVELLKSKNGKTDYDRLEPLSWKVKTIDGKSEVCTLRGDLWKDFYKDMGNVGEQGGVKLKNGKKPERLIMDLLTAFTNEGDIVLDAYLGSGTTCAVAHKMGRRYVGIEQLDDHYSMAVKRLINVIEGDTSGISKSTNWCGGGAFVECSIAKMSAFLIDKIINTHETNEINTLFKEIVESPYLNYIDDIREINAGFNVLQTSAEEKKEFLLKLIDQNTYYLNYSEMLDAEFKLDDASISFTESIYNGGED